MNSIQSFFEFVYKRQKVWYNRSVSNLPAPWSDDPILQKFRFTNVYRELDRVTRYIVGKIADNPNLPFQKKLFNILIGRVFNTDHVFTDVLPLLDPYDYNWKDWESHLDEKIESGVQLWNNAYTVCQVPVDPSYRKSDKHIQFLKVFDIAARQIDRLTSDLQNSRSLAQAVDTVKRLPLIGGFLGGEIVLDLTYCRPHFFLNKMDDNHDLAVLGPGAVGTVELLFPDLKRKEQGIYLLYEQQEEQFKLLNDRTGMNWVDIAYKDAYSNVPYLSINNVEGACCEYRKYVNLSIGKGRKKYFVPQS